MLIKSSKCSHQWKAQITVFIIFTIYDVCCVCVFSGASFGEGVTDKRVHVDDGTQAVGVVELLVCQAVYLPHDYHSGHLHLAESKL